MAEEIVFSWTGSPQAMAASTDPWADKPAWARVAGFGCADLSSLPPPTAGPHWWLLEETPVVGRTYPLRVWRPFRGALGDPIWVVYPPLTPEPAEWCDVPAALPTAGLARCRLLDLLSHEEPDPVYGPGAWLQVAIEEAIALPDLAARFAPETAGPPLPPSIAPGSSTYLWGCHWGDLHFLGYSAEGDVREWVVWQRHPGGAAVLLGGDRIHDDDIIYAGHRPLGGAERRAVEAWQAAAERREAARQADAVGERVGPPPDPPGAAGAPAVPTPPDAATVGPEQRRGRQVWERWRSRLRP
jgi:hypothetical protein